MTEAQLDRIEAELGLTLPADYRALSREFPFQPIGNWQVYWFYNDPDIVINATRFPLNDGDYTQENWRGSYLVIGHGAAGDLHLIDTALAASPMYLLSHEDHSITEEWPSLDAFVEGWNREVALAQQQAAERAQQRKAEADKTRRQAWILFAFFVLSIVVMILLIRSPHKRQPRHSATKTLSQRLQRRSEA